MFMKFWAHICRSKKPVLLQELTPFYDRTVIKDPNGLDMSYLNLWLGFTGVSNPKDDPNLFQFSSVSELPLDSARRSFELTKADIAELRQGALSTWPSSSPAKPHLTSFVLTFSHALLKALEVDEEIKSRNMIFTGAG